MESVHLSKLRISNFRNLANDLFEFDQNINCIFGANGNGKTNLLEAISIITNKKSFKKSTTFADILSVDGDKPEIQFTSLFNDEVKDISFSGKITKDGEVLYLNNQLIKKRSLIHSLFLSPFDSYLFHNTPSFRRSWIDQYASIVNLDYQRELSRFRKHLKIRNELLSKKNTNWQKILKANDVGFIDSSINIIKFRLSFLERVNQKQDNIFKMLFSEQHRLQFFYQTKFSHLNSSKIEQYYTEALVKDAAIGYTHYGVQRDDYYFELDGINSSNFCSLGQQKMAYLSLIFSYLDMYHDTYSRYPIVLIDDVSGELDEQRWRQLINFLKIKNFQVFITTANDYFKKELEKIKNANKITIKSGSIF